MYGDLGESASAAESIRKSYELRDQTSEAEKYFISANFHLVVTGNMQEAAQICELWIHAYPRADIPRTMLAGFIYPALGQDEKAVEEGIESVRLNPDFPLSYNTLIFAYLAVNRLDEAKATYEKAFARRLDSPFLRFARYEIAFLQNDAAAMAQQVAWSADKPGVEDELLGLEAGTAAYSGRLRNARELLRRAAYSADRAGEKETAATYLAVSALREAFFGNADEARRHANSATSPAAGRDVLYGVALALAYARDDGRVQTLADDLAERFPEDTLVQFNYLPTIRAKLAINKGNPSEAIETLKAASPYELGSSTSSVLGWTALYPVFVRGEAYLAAHQGSEATVEFQKILDHRGIVVNDPIGALAHLGLARGYALQGDTNKSRAAYEDFLTLWKDAEPDISVLIGARSEFAKLKS
jgi:tetratricopeptide (TPR) repeat protein